jgi:hypothetical protein
LSQPSSGEDGESLGWRVGAGVPFVGAGEATVGVGSTAVEAGAGEEVGNADSVQPANKQAIARTTDEPMRPRMAGMARA